MAETSAPQGPVTTAAVVNPAGPERRAPSGSTEAPSTTWSQLEQIYRGEALARQANPATPTGAQHLTLVGASGLQGRRNVIPLSTECEGTVDARVEGYDLPIADADQNPATFTLDAVGLELGTKAITFDCGDQIVANFDLFVYRQNGAERGGANSIALVSAVALGAMIALFAVPGTLSTPLPGRRVEGPAPWPPPTPR